MEAQFSLLSATLLLIFVIDPFGTIPLLMSVLKGTIPQRQRKIILRDGVIGLLILMFFLFFGARFLQVLHLETESISIAGGVVLFVIALKMIFPGVPQATASESREPYIVPIAMPIFAGPSTVATLLVLVKSHPSETLSLSMAVVLAWGISLVMFLLAPLLSRLLKEKGLAALERLMGMLLLMMAVQMLVNGVRGLILHMSL